MKKTLMIATLAGLACSAVAQNDQYFTGEQLVAERVTVGTEYNSRASAVFANGSFGGPNLVFFGALYDILEDASFAGTAWDGATGRVITEMEFGIGKFANSLVTTGTVRYAFYDAEAIDALNGGTPGAAFTNPTDMLGAATPFFSQDFTGLASGSGIYTYYTVGGLAITVPDGINRIYVRATIIDPVTGGTWGNPGVAPGSNPASAYVPGQANDLTVGQALTNCALNTFNVYVAPAFTGNANPGRGFGTATPAGTTQEHRNSATPPTTNGTTAFRSLMMTLKGDLVIPEPAGTVDLGTLADGCAPQTFTLADGETKYYKITLPGDATDTALQFFDADTEGAAADVSIAIWDTADGSVVASDLDDGSGTNGQMSFGIGRRPAVGDGSCYDGRDGELLATSTYIIGVAAGNAAFGPAYSVGGAGTGGAVTLNLCTNAGGTAVGASIAPCQVTDLGDISALAGDPAPADMEPGWVVWYKFNNCTEVADDADAGAQGTYVDFDFSTSFVGSDTMAMVFNSSGALVATSDDEGNDAFSQFSWGDVAPARSSTGNGDPFAGQNGALTAGEYYMAVGLFGLVEGGTNRFHVRSTSGSSLPAAFVVYSNSLTACGGGCPVCAADFNQDGGVDGPDIEAFFVTWEAGDVCGDVNQDGGTDGSDIEAFFALWEAGGC